MDVVNSKMFRFRVILSEAFSNSFYGGHAWGSLWILALSENSRHSLLISFCSLETAISHLLFVQICLYSLPQMSFDLSKVNEITNPSKSTV